jgi:hypothetical protein
VTAPSDNAKSGHLSYSALSDWLSCGKLYQLKRMLGLPDRPAWWNVGGHAVHSATEAFDRQLFAEYSA